MAAQELKRKLAAILHADVKGYSRLMGGDEEWTFRTLHSYKVIMGSLVQQYRGRLAGSAGDSVLAEFASVVDAVQCAVEIQQVLRAKNAVLPENRRMEFRIGINLGDVIDEGDTIYGDGVNIAARLESLAEAGGICISESAYQQIENKLPLKYKYLGEHEVKNIAKPVRVYQAQIEPEAAPSGVSEGKKPSRKWLSWPVLAIAAPLVITGLIVLWQFGIRPSLPGLEKASTGKMAVPLPDRPSIAVLPFVNMSEDPKQEYFSDGFTEDIITNLSKLPALLVVSRNSTFLYKGKPVKIEDVAKELGVRHVLEGSVRRMGNRVRITAQLIDGKTGKHLWADKYDRELKDIFSVQDEVIRKVVSELALALTTIESEYIYRKYTENFEAYDMFLQAREKMQVVGNKEDHFKAIELSKRVIDLDPHFAGGYQNLSFLLSRGIRSGWSESPREDLEKAFELAQKAISVDDKFPLSYMALASVYLLQGKHDDAVAAMNRGVMIAPGDSITLLWLGAYLHWAGRGEEAIDAIKKSMKLNPMYLSGKNPVYLDYMGMACFTAGRYEEAILNSKMAIEKFGSHQSREPFLIASYSMLGRDEEAKEATRQWLKANPTFFLSSWNLGRMYKRSEDRERLLEALRKAGLK